MNQNNSSLPPLSPRERWDLLFCLLAWSFAICNVTLIVGTSNAIVLSINETAGNVAALPLATFFAGSALVSSFGLLDALFVTEGRKYTFFVGIALSLTGTILGALSLLVSSWILLAVGTACFGAANGIAFHLRFAAMTVVPMEWAATAASLTVSGGVVAAFGGPEVSHWVRGVFGMDSFEYLGVFLMTGVYGLAGALCTAMVDFGDAAQLALRAEMNEDEERRNPLVVYATLLSNRSFVVPMLLAGLAWSVMALPMSVARVAMADEGYSQREFLTTIELHFVGMYAPGLIAGLLIRCSGYRVTCGMGVLASVVAMALHLIARGKDETIFSTSFWVAGLIALGVGWNLAFTGATVWLTNASIAGVSLHQVQSANDCFMFLIAAIFTSSASFVYERFGAGLSGWRTVNAVALALLTLYALIVAGDCLWERKSPERFMISRKELDILDNSMIDEVMEEMEEQNFPSPSRQLPPMELQADQRVIPALADSFDMSVFSDEQAIEVGGPKHEQRPEERVMISIKDLGNFSNATIVEVMEETEEEQLPPAATAVRTSSLVAGEQHQPRPSEPPEEQRIMSALTDSFDISVYADEESKGPPPPPPPVSELKYLEPSQGEEWQEKLNNTFSTDEETRDNEEWPDDEVMVSHVE